MRYSTAIGRLTTCALVLALALFLTTSAATGKDASGTDEVGAILRDGRISSLVQSFSGPFSDANVSQHLKGRGSVALREGKYNEAAAHFGSALSFDEKDIWSRWQRCWALTELRLFSAAHIDCDAAVNEINTRLEQAKDVSVLTDDYVAVYSAVANLLRAEGLAQQIIEEFYSLYELELLGPLLRSSDRLTAHLAHALADVGATEESLILVKNLLDSNELVTVELDALLLLRANLYSRLNKFEEAILDYSQLVTEHPADARYAYFLCSEQIKAKQWEDAEVNCARVSRMAPDRELYALAYAVSLFHNGRIEESLTVLRPVQDARPKSNLVERYVTAAEVMLGLVKIEDATVANVNDAKLLIDLIQNVNGWEN